MMNNRQVWRTQEESFRRGKEDTGRGSFEQKFIRGK